VNEIVFINTTAIRELTDADFQQVAEGLNVPEAAVRAFAEVEASGEGFLPDGRPKILYEAHVFHRETKGKFSGAKDRNGVLLSSQKWDRSLYGRPGEHQYERLNDAMALDVDAALKATSWGAFQIMGFNYQMVGYDSVQSMVEDQVSGMAGQLRSFAGFIRAKKLEPDMRKLPDPQAAARLARAYNGEAYRENHYDSKIVSSYERHARGGGAPPPYVPPLRLGSRGDAVRTLQVRLGLPADGAYGPQTMQAVREQQRAASITEDGIAGPVTHGILGLPWPPLT
jgi:hypothetical protein